MKAASVGRTHDRTRPRRHDVISPLRRRGRPHRTLKENLLWVQTFDTVEALRQALLTFRDTYNSTWLIQRHGFRPPNAVRQEQLSPAALAA